MKNSVLVIICFMAYFLVNNSLIAQWNLVYYHNPENGIIFDLWVNKTTLFAQTLTGTIISTNFGESWQKMPEKLQNEHITAFYSDENEIIVAVKKDGFYHSTDDGKTWFRKSNELKGKFIYNLIKNQYRLIATTDNAQIFLSDDNGFTWYAAKKNDKMKDFQAWGIAVDSNTIYLAGNYAIFYSQDNGLTWKFHSNQPYFFYKLFFFGKKLYGLPALNKGIILSFDKGINWKEINEGLPKNKANVRDYAIYKNIIFISLSSNSRNKGGVFFSIDSGFTWIDITNNIYSNFTHNLAIVANYLFCNVPITNADNYGGIFRAYIPDLINGTETNDFQVEVSKEFYISSPYPIPASDIVRFKIFWNTAFVPQPENHYICDIYGRRIQRQGNIIIRRTGEFSAILEWVCSDVPTGIYFIVIDYLGDIRTKPIAIVK